MVKEQLRERIREALEAIPSGYRSDAVLKETIRCVLYGYLKEQGLTPVPAFRNPRFPEGPVDIVGIRGDRSIAAAFCSAPTVELDHVKSLDRVPSDEKWVITFSPLKQKVTLSTFYLKPGIQHLSVHDTEDQEGDKGA